MLMVGSEWFDNSVMIEQMGSGSCIFCEYQVHLFQHFKGPKCNIFQIANWCGNKVEHNFGLRACLPTGRF